MAYGNRRRTRNVGNAVATVKYLQLGIRYATRARHISPIGHKDTQPHKVLHFGVRNSIKWTMPTTKQPAGDFHKQLLNFDLNF